MSPPTCSAFNFLRTALFAGALSCAVAGHARANEAMRSLALGDDLARHAIDKGDALALLAALRILRASELHGSRARLAGVDAPADRLPPRAQLLEKAKSLAQGQPELLALIADEAVQRSRGTKRGPQAERLLIRSGKYQELMLAFDAGKPAVFGVSGDRLHELKFEVLDAKNQALCQPVTRNAELRCEWVASDAAEVRVRLENRSPIATAITFFHD